MPAFELLSIGLGLGLFFAEAAADAQGTFTFHNLDFESASFSGYLPDSQVPISAAMPGWSAYLGAASIQTVVYDGVSVGSGQVSIADSFISVGSLSPIQGSYSALLFGGAFGAGTISQTGLVPTGTKSLVVDMRWGQVSPLVTLDGQTIAMLPVKVFPTYAIYAGDIAQFAGQSATLSFTSPVPTYTAS
jgi:hypothetical protein